MQSVNVNAQPALRTECRARLARYLRLFAFPGMASISASVIFNALRCLARIPSLWCMRRIWIYFSSGVFGPIIFVKLAHATKSFSHSANFYLNHFIKWIMSLVIISATKLWACLLHTDWFACVFRLFAYIVAIMCAVCHCQAGIRAGICVHDMVTFPYQIDVHMKNGLRQEAEKITNQQEHDIAQLYENGVLRMRAKGRLPLNGRSYKS